MKRSESIAELAKALSAAQGEMPAVPKGSVNPFFSSSYADLADVVKVAAPVLSKHGLSISQDPETVDGVEWLTSLLMHSSGEWKESAVQLHVAKNDSQAHGSALTYMRRYCYCAILGIVADADDDGNAASGAEHSPTTRTNGTVKGSYADKHPDPVEQAEKMASEAQMGLIEKLCTKTLTDMPTGELSMAQARTWIDQLKAKEQEIDSGVKA